MEFAGLWDKNYVNIVMSTVDGL